MVIYMYLCRINYLIFIKIGHPVLLTKKIFMFKLLYYTSFVIHYKPDGYFIGNNLFGNCSGKMVVEV